METTSDEINILKKGVQLDDGFAKFNSINQISKKNKVNSWYKVAISEEEIMKLRGFGIQSVTK